jgi:hypothetical protein
MSADGVGAARGKESIAEYAISLELPYGCVDEDISVRDWPHETDRLAHSCHVPEIAKGCPDRNGDCGIGAGHKRLAAARISESQKSWRIRQPQSDTVRRALFDDEIED